MIEAKITDKARKIRLLVPILLPFLLSNTLYADEAKVEIPTPPSRWKVKSNQEQKKMASDAKDPKNIEEAFEKLKELKRQHKSASPVDQEKLNRRIKYLTEWINKEEKRLSDLVKEPS